MKIDIDPTDAKVVKLDDRGRGCFGTEYANEEVEVVIVEVKDDEG